MTKSTLIRLTACVSSVLSLVGCSSQSASPGPTGGGDPGVGGSTQGTSVGGASATGGGSAVGGASSPGGTSGNVTGGTKSATGGSSPQSTTSNAGGSSSTTGGKSSTTATGGSSSTTGGKTSTSTGGTKATGGSSSSAGGKTSTGGTSGVATGGTAATGGTRTSGGTSATGGTSAAGGTVATGGSVAATGGVSTDQNGKSLAKPGDKTSNTHDYLYLGNMRLINNNWGSVELNNSGKSCNAPQSVEVKSDGSLGWTFNRGNCGDDGGHPDYPELEFGVGPFGSASSLLTSPEFSSTTLLPIQIKDIQSATVNVDNFAINLQGGTNWNLNIEFWLSRNNPLTNPDGGVYAEFMGVWGWNEGSTWWNCTPPLNQSVNSGGKTYNLCHQSDSWGGGPTWRFFQFTGSGGSQRSFNGTVDIKAFLDWFFGSSYASGASKDLWLTRIELGTEIGDSTSGTCSIRNVTFNINGTSQGPLLQQ